MATIDITTRAAATTPSNANEATLFLDSGNNNALTAKFYDSTFKTLSEQPVQFTVSEPLTDALNDKFEHLTCSAAKGIISMTDLESYMNNVNLYYTSNIDANGNLNQSITSAPVSAASVNTANNISVVGFSPGNSAISAFRVAYTSTTPASDTSTLQIDRGGVTGDFTVTFTAPAGVSGLTYTGNSYTTDSLGTVTAHANKIAEGTSLFVGLFDYDGTAIVPGNYTGLVTLTSGSISKYISVEIIIS